MKIFTLEEAKGEVLGIFTTSESMTYKEFYKICKEVAEEFDNDFYMVKDTLLDMGFLMVDFMGGYVVSKRKGTF